MLTERETISKLEHYAAEFNGYMRVRDYGKAHAIYNEALMVATFMKMGDVVLKRLFGDWESDDGSDSDTALDNGLFTRSAVAKVDLESCILRHKAYEDMACRKMGRPVQYYSDIDFCARCMKKKKADQWK